MFLKNYLKINLRKIVINKKDLMNSKNTSFSSRFTQFENLSVRELKRWCNPLQVTVYYNNNIMFYYYNNKVLLLIVSSFKQSTFRYNGVTSSFKSKGDRNI